VRFPQLGNPRQQGTVVNNIRTGVTIEATSIMNGKTVSGTYRDGQGKEMVLKPNLEDNAVVMNKHLSAALARMVGDARLTTP
jgi:uncharacterized lipoprotein YajG